jgi:hypothetical protein
MLAALFQGRFCPSALQSTRVPLARFFNFKGEAPVGGCYHITAPKTIALSGSIERGETSGI